MAHDMSILCDLGFLGCLTTVSPMISLQSVPFPRPTPARSTVVQPMRRNEDRYVFLRRLYRDR